MNILTDALPTAVMIDGKPVPINSNFRECLRIILAFEDPELTIFEKQVVMVRVLYPQVPANFEAAVKQGVKFLDGGHDPDESDGADPQPRVYSFSKDSGLIYAAFYQTHGIDLETASMHWWKFIALFMDLGQDTAFCGLTGLRKRVKTGQATKSERQLANSMGDAFDIPEIDDRSVDEKEIEDEFVRKVKEAEARRRASK